MRTPSTLRRGGVLRTDVTIAVGLVAVEALQAVFVGRFDTGVDWAWQLPFDAVALAAVAVRRRYFWVAVGIVCVHTLVPFLGLGHVHLRSAGLAVLAMTYTAAVCRPLRAALGALVLLWVPPLTLAVLLNDTGSGAFQLPPAYFLAFNGLTALVCFLIGRTIATRRAYVAALVDRARTAETSQRALTERAVAEERRRIARELHDVVAHHVSVMGVLATGTRRTLARDPKAADEALATIEETGRAALREMRRLLTVLRGDAEPVGELAPQPGLAGVEGLVEQIREAGLPATLKVEGPAETLDPGVALTVYRIVQEALTNALKHAGHAVVEVRLVFGPQDLVVEICDTGRGPQLAGNTLGHGLLGMRERVMLYGGTLRTGPRPGGGYRVYAKIPLDNPERRLAS